MQKDNTPRVFVFFGLIASGKTHLAKAFAGRQGYGYHNTDVVRKELAGQLPTAKNEDRYGKGIYNPEVSLRTYEALLHLAEEDLRQGRTTVLDGSYHSRTERTRIVALAEKYHVPCLFIECICPEAERRKRMTQRQLDPNTVSDGRWEIYCNQKLHFESPDELPAAMRFTLTTTQPVPELIEKLETTIQQI